MKVLRKTIVIFMIIVLALMLVDNTKLNAFASSDLSSRDITKTGILFFDLNNKYMQLIKAGLEEIEKSNSDKVQFTFFDSKNNVSEQNAILSNMINSDFDLLVLNLFNVSESELKDNIFKIMQKDIPVVFMNVDPQEIINLSKYYNKAAFIAADYKTLGMEQGKVIADLWNSSKQIIDKNNDNILNYIIIEGRKNSEIAIGITKGFESTIKELGVDSKHLEKVNADWNKGLAKNAITSLFLRYGGSIEAIISNTDEMAIGALEALQGYGYNTGDKSKSIIIISSDGFQQTKELIDKGFITATVEHDKHFMAKAIYDIGMNLVNNVDPLQNTNYKVENGQIIIPIPHDIYINKSNLSGS